MFSCKLLFASKDTPFVSQYAGVAQKRPVRTEALASARQDVAQVEFAGCVGDDA